jgi:hypothetical protein
VRPDSLVDHRERVGGQRVLGGQGGQQYLVAGPQPAAVPDRGGITMWGRSGTVTMPPGSRRATITPSWAVRVSRSPPRQPSALMIARSATRPEASMRPNP